MSQAVQPAVSCQSDALVACVVIVLHRSTHQLGLGSVACARSVDGTARVWNLKDGHLWDGPVVLQHGQGQTGDAAGNKDVTTLDWSPDGQCLATGSCSGLVRAWSKEGEHVVECHCHTSKVSLLWDAHLP